jgi:hypothetical protein
VPGQSTVKTCFPKAIACSADQACPTGWTCIDFTQVYDSDPLQIWAATGDNDCWPDSLNGVLYREIRTDSSGLGLSGVSGGTDKSSTDAGRAVTKSGCAIGGSNTSASWTLLALAFVGLLRLGRTVRKD